MDWNYKDKNDFYNTGPTSHTKCVYFQTIYDEIFNIPLYLSLLFKYFKIHKHG